MFVFLNGKFIRLDAIVDGSIGTEGSLTFRIAGGEYITLMSGDEGYLAIKSYIEENSVKIKKPAEARHSRFLRE